MAVRHLGAAEHTALTGTLRAAWPGLPALLAASAAVCAGAAATVFLAPGVTPVSVLLAAVLVGPAAAALARAAQGELTLRQWALAARQSASFGLLQALVAAVPTAAFLVALALWRQTGTAWLLPSVAVSGAAALLALTALTVALPLGTLRGGLRGRLLWLCSLHLVVRHPLRHLSGPSLLLLGLWASVHWTASLLLLAPGPAMVIAVAAVRVATAREQDQEEAAISG